MKVTLITGLAGAGKSCVVKAFEDLGYYCVDNLPLSLLEHCVEALKTSDKKIDRVALVIDGRNAGDVADLPKHLDALGKQEKISLEVIFLDAKDDILIRRFHATRHRHPIQQISILESIRNERDLMSPIRSIADYILNTSALNVHQLRQEIFQRYEIGHGGSTMMVSVLSFGFKNGLPLNADLVFDVRFLKNPFFEPELRDKTGLHPKIKSYVGDQTETKDFMKKLEEMLLFLLPHYEAEGKTYCTVAIGCTGGKHRSVVLAGKLLARLEAKNYAASLVHRDLSINA